MRLIPDKNVERGDIRFGRLNQATDRQDFYARPPMGGLFDDYGVNFCRIGANSNKSLVGGSSIKTQVSKIPQKNALRGNAAVKLDHFTFVIQTYRAELEPAETWNFNNLLQMHATGKPRTIRNWFLGFGTWTRGNLHCDRT